jgi:hypothetical protein
VFDRPNEKQVFRLGPGDHRLALVETHAGLAQYFDRGPEG